MKKNNFNMIAVATPNLSTFVSYCNYANSFSILTQEQEDSLVERFYNKQDIKAAQEIFLHHLKLVVKVAVEYKSYAKNSIMELVAEGNIGLLESIKKFDPKKGVRISTYAIQWIRYRIQEYIINSFSILNGGESKIKEKFFRKSQKDAIDIQQHSSIDYENSNGDKIYADLVYTNSNQLENTISSIDGGDISDKIVKAISSLSKNEQIIVQKRYQQEEKSTLDELSKELNLSKERVRQIEVEAMKKIKNKIS